jgi:transcriptional regulator with XRE-family HTH domain
MRDIGKNITELRQQKNMTQDELAEKLFVTRQTVSNYETGKSRPDIEMLTQIASVLETDANTILYGIPQTTRNRRMLIKLCVAVAGLIVLLIGYQHITALAKEYQGRYYDYSITSASVVLARPAVAFLAGWTVLQALQVFAKLSPFKDPWAKRLRWSVIISVAVYVFLSLPVLTIWLFGVGITTAMPRFISDAWCYASYWLMGIYYNMHVKPNAILFGILGCMLWLGCPQKKEE